MSRPDAMRMKGRPIDPHFHAEECLFRRVPTSLWPSTTTKLGIDAVDLPDISVGRSKFGHPEWVRFDTENNKYYDTWGITGVYCVDIPSEIWEEGVKFTFAPSHEPTDGDYPHSEIQASSDGIHLMDQTAIPDEIDLKFRTRLLKKLITVIKPEQKVLVRQNPPISHKLEMFTTTTD